MKIKSDFVTNSSSTGYIVCIPEDFKVSDKDILKAYEEQELFLEDEKLTMNEINIELKHILYKTLKIGEEVWSYNYSTYSLLFSMTVYICEINEFLLSVFEIPNEGNNMIQGIKEKDIKKWLINTQLHKIKIEVPDEQN